MSTTNGIYKYVTSILVMILISVVGAWAAYTNVRIDRQDERISTIEKAIAANTVTHEAMQADLKEILRDMRELRRSR